MRLVRLSAFLAAGSMVAACAEGPATSVSMAGQPGAEAFAPPAIAQSPVRVRNTTVRVPETLRVSEANSYLPAADIVWRGDPLGDRYAQVSTIFEDAVARGVQPLKGPVPVDLEIEVVRFHALTERTRYTIGGRHAITFDMTVRSTATGDPVVAVRRVRADLNAFGGQQALAAEAQGLTQKVRIEGHLAEVIQRELIGLPLSR